MQTAIDLPGRVLLVGAADGVAELSRTIAELGWLATSVESSNEALRRLRDDVNADMVVLVPGPTLEPSLELCRSIKFDARTAFIAVVLLIPACHEHRVEDAYDAGADDCIRASAHDRELVLRFRKALRLKQATDSLEDSQAVITALANAVEGKDHYTCGHVDRVGAYCVAIGRHIGVDAEGLAALRIGGAVHDIGKIGIPDQILNKPGKLTDEEVAVMQRHPAIGYDILKPLRTFRNVLPIVRWHHERPNGKGYPDGLKGDELPLLPRITAVADVFDALITDRPYRKGFSLEKCKEILLQTGAGGDLDVELVKVLFSIIDTGALYAQAA